MAYPRICDVSSYMNGNDLETHRRDTLEVRARLGRANTRAQSLFFFFFPFFFSFFSFIGFLERAFVGLISRKPWIHFSKVFTS